ncbi:hypothetical protein IE53DRAFT_385791 [Violaceomyces palustris]|uniref:Uncharacterized protein n=1 Tax=Violaceomyces palustris TaxID=1673888 RepID=A0ACD0P1D7_9BASI|nr:hypothetical protein IE53DRAFT_385791 [Violaceomyces palustris]
MGGRGGIRVGVISQKKLFPFPPCQGGILPRSLFCLFPVLITLAQICIASTCGCTLTQNQIGWARLHNSDSSPSVLPPSSTAKERVA